MPQHGRTVRHRSGRAHRLQGGLDAARLQSGQGTFNAEVAHRLLVE
jgi:hypothetical protein